jgi:hypothetical protein
VYKFFNLPKIYLLKTRNVFADLVGAVFAEIVAEVNSKNGDRCKRAARANWVTGMAATPNRPDFDDYFKGLSYAVRERSNCP